MTPMTFTMFYLDWENMNVIINGYKVVYRVIVFSVAFYTNDWISVHTVYNLHFNTLVFSFHTIDNRNNISKNW